VTFFFSQALKEAGFDVRRTIGQADPSMCFGGYHLVITTDGDMAGHVHFLRIMPEHTEEGRVMVMKLFLKEDILDRLRLHPEHLHLFSNLTGSFYFIFLPRISDKCSTFFLH
jgi:hypothetical protein